MARGNCQKDGWSIFIKQTCLFYISSLALIYERATFMLLYIWPNIKQVGLF